MNLHDVVIVDPNPPWGVVLGEIFKDYLPRLILDQTYTFAPVTNIGWMNRTIADDVFDRVWQYSQVMLERLGRLDGVEYIITREEYYAVMAVLRPVDMLRGPGGDDMLYGVRLVVREG